MPSPVSPGRVPPLAPPPTLAAPRPALSRQETDDAARTDQATARGQGFPARLFPAQPADGPLGPDAPATAGHPVSPALSPLAHLIPQPPPWPPQNPGDPSWRQGSGGYGSPYGQPEPARKRTGLKILGVVLALVLVGGIALVVKGGTGKLFDAVGAGGSGVPSATAPTGGGSASSAPSAALTGPFQNTPAAAYAEGEAGIALPAGTAIPGFTAAQVDAGLQQVKQALIAARLDPAMLASHDPNALLKLLSPQASKEVKPYFDSQKFFGFATQVAPGYFLTSDKVRVSGQVTFRGSTANSVRLLEVVTNFVWVYPFEGALQEPGDHLVIVHDQVTWAIPVDTDVDKAYRGLRLSGWDGFASNMDCDLLKQSLLALGKPQFVTAGTDADANAAFDPSRSLNVTSTC